MKKHCPTEQDDNGETEQSLDVGERLQAMLSSTGGSLVQSTQGRAV